MSNHSLHSYQGSSTNRMTIKCNNKHVNQINDIEKDDNEMHENIEITKDQGSGLETKVTMDRR